MSNETKQKVDELVQVYRSAGAQAAAERFKEIAATAKAWEARAIREAFAEAIKS